MINKMFNNKNFALLSLGGFISSIGDYLYNIGILVFLYTETKSVMAIAFMWLSRAALRIPILFLSGIIADRFNKKKVIVYTNLISMIIALLFIFVNKDTVWLAYILAFLLQSLNDIDVSSETAILPELVKKEELSFSNSIFSFLDSVGIFISPAIGGIIYKIYGSNILFVINAVSFLVAGILFLFISYKQVEKEVSKAKFSVVKDSIEGYKILNKYAGIKIVFATMSVYAIMGRFYETYKVAVADTLLNIKPEGIVYFDYAMAIGGLLVPFIVKALSKNKESFVFIMSSFIISIGYIVFGYSHNFIATFAILIILGFTLTTQGIFSRTIIQKEIPSEYLGRVFSFYKILLTLFAIIGILIAGPLYKYVGIGNAFIIFIIISLVICTFQLIKANSESEVESTNI